MAAFVAPNSAAEAAGVQVGDVICEIDGHTAEKLSIRGIRSRLATPSKRLLTVRRDGKNVRITLQLHAPDADHCE